MQRPSLASDLMADARSYLSRQLSGLDMSGYPDEAIRGCINQAYPGGWSAYEADFVRSYRELQRKVTRVAEELSPIKRKALVQHFIGRKLRLYDEIVSATFTDTEVNIALSIADVDYRSRRDIIRGRTLELHRFTRPDTSSPWKRDEVSMSEVTDEAHVRFGAVNTPDRDEAIREQVETCYRPGTHKTPMQGWIARAELSWRDAHADEDFQAPTA